MNWFKQNQNSINIGAILYTMLIDAGKNPAKPIDVINRLQGSMPDEVAEGLNFAYNKVLSEYGNVLNENQQKVLIDAQMMIQGENLETEDNVTQNPNEIFEENNMDESQQDIISS